MYTTLCHSQSPVPTIENTKAINEYQNPASITNPYYINIAKQLHERGFWGQGVIVAVIDAGFSGVDRMLDDSATDIEIQNYSSFTNYDNSVFQISDHGTRVLSQLATLDHNFMFGTAPKSTYLLATSEDITRECRMEEKQWEEAMNWANTQGAQIICSSLNYSTFDNPIENYNWDSLDGNTSTITKAVDEASRRGILVVCSAGNEGRSTWRKIGMPCDADSVLCVGSIDSQGKKSHFSSWGPTADGRIKPDVVALGDNVMVINENKEVKIDDGTSFAAPQVAGLAACLWSACSKATAMDVRESIVQSSNRFSNPDTGYGFGFPDALLALKILTDKCDLLHYTENLTNETLTVSINQKHPVNYFLTLFSECGDTLFTAILKSEQQSVLIPIEKIASGKEILVIKSIYGYHEKQIYFK